MALVVWGDPAASHITVEADRVVVAPYSQEYNSYSNLPGIQRASQAGVTKKALSDLSGGLLVAPDIRDFTTDYNRYGLNRGVQTRLPGLAILPFLITNQSSISDDESIAAAVAANWRCHGLNTAVGGTQAYLVGLGNRVYRANTSTGALEVANGNIDGAGSAASMGAVVTAIAELEVGSAKVVAVALKGAANILYTTAPAATPIVWTTLVNTTDAADYITGMSFYETLGPGTNVVVGKVGGVSGIWYALGSSAAAWTLQPLVLADSKDEPGSLATVDTAATYPGWADADNSQRINNSAAPTEYNWFFVDNIVGDDAAGATFEINATAAIGDASGYLHAGGFDFSAVPRAAVIVGIKLEIDKEVGVDTVNVANINDVIIQLLVGASAKGINRPDVDNYWPTDTAYTTYGGLTDTWGADWTGADLSSIVVRIVGGHTLEIPDAGVDANATGRVNNVRLTVRYRMPGTQVGLSTGGFQLKRNPAFPLRMTVLTPRADEVATIILPRDMWHLDFAWDTASNRPVMALQQTNIGMLNAHAATPSQGGWLVAGDNVVGPGTLVKSQDVNGDLRNFAFPGFHGEAVRVNQVFEQGSWGIHEVVAADYTERQWWFSVEDVYYPDTLLQSLTDLQIAAQPIPWAEAETNLSQRLIYSIFPNGSDVAVARQHLPSNLGLDPRLIDTDKDKTMTDADGAVYVESPKFAIGPPEALQTVLVAEYQGEDISDDDTVQLSIAIDGEAFNSAQIEHTFTEPMEVYEVPSAGVASKFVQYRLGIKHTIADNTPNALPILLTTEQEWPEEWRIVVYASDFSKSGDLFQLMHALLALKAERSVQPLWLTPYPVVQRAMPAVFEGWSWPDSGVTMPPSTLPRAQIPASLTRQVTRGGKTEEVPLEIGMIFRTVPGSGVA